MCGRCGTGVSRGSPWTPASWRSPVSRSRNKKDQNARQHCAHSGLGVRQPLLEEVLPSPGADGQSEAQSGAGLVRGHQVREQQGRGWSLASSAGFGLRPPTPTRGSSFFPLLFITALGPQPAWLPPAISPYHCSGSQPWALWRQSPLGPSWQGVEGRWGGGPLWGQLGQAELGWPVFSPPGSLWGRGGAEWAGVAGPAEGCCLLPAPAIAPSHRR